MLIAVDENGDRIVAAEDLKRRVRYYCPSCENPVHLKKGSVMRPHFAHYQNEACDIFSEGETAEHIQGKFELMALFEKEGFKVEMEAYLPALQQRPDLLLVDQKCAVEFQCSQILIDKVVERTHGYLNAGYDVVWILGEQFKLREQLTAFQKVCLTEWRDQICLFKYSVERQELVVESNFKKATKRVDYRKRHAQLQKSFSYGANSFQKVLYENGDSIISMPVELYHPVSYEWMIHGNSYIWKYQFVLWLESLPVRRVITRKLLERWMRQTLKYYSMPQISDRKKMLPIIEFIEVLVESGVLKAVGKGDKWAINHYPRRFKYLEEKF